MDLQIEPLFVGNFALRAGSEIELGSRLLKL